MEPAEPTAAPTEVAWITDDPIGRAMARRERKPMVVYFTAAWCSACKELEHQAFPDERVRREIGRFVAIQIDATDDEAPAVRRARAQYAVLGLPTIVVFDSSGKEVGRVTEFVPAASLTTVLEGAR